MKKTIRSLNISKSSLILISVIFILFTITEIESAQVKDIAEDLLQKIPAADQKKIFAVLPFTIGDNINDKKISEIAEKLALDMPKFQESMKDPAIMRLVRDDMQEGRLQNMPWNQTCLNWIETR